MATVQNGNVSGTGSIVPGGGVPENTYKGPVDMSINNTAQGAALVNANKEQAAKMGITIPGSTYKEPTVMSNYNVVNTKIPENNNKLATLAATGAETGKDGLVRYSDNSFARAPEGANQNEDGTWGKDGLSYGVGPASGDNPEIKKWNDTIDNMKGQFDAMMNAQISAIDAQFQQLTKKQEDINMRAEASTGQSLLMGGSSRYAQISSAGIVQGQASYGLGLIADLQAKKNQAVAAAQQAQQDGDFKFMEKSMNLAQDIYKQQQDAATKLSDALVKANDDIRAQERDSSRDSAIGMLIGQGVSDPAEMLNMLNEGGFKVTADEVSKSMKALTVEQKDPAKLPQDIEAFNYLKKNGMIPAGILGLPESQQYLAYLNMQHLANLGKLNAAGKVIPESDGTAPVVPGKGVTSPVEEQIVRMRLFSKLMNVLNKGAVSDSDAARINGNIATLRNAGYSEQDIMSQLAGFPATVKTPYNSSFISAIASNTDNLDQQQNIMAKVGQLLDAGDSQSAMNIVENTAMKNAAKIDPNNYLGTGTAETYTKKIDNVKSLLQEYWPATVGPISGTTQQILGKLKSNQAQELQSAIADLTISLRHDIAGSAVTQSESSFLEPLITSLSDKKGNFMEKLDALQNRIKVQYNSTRSVAGLPEVNVKQILDKKSRLDLYGNGQTDNPFESSLNSTGTYNISSAPGVYEIPDQK